jgi:hypothetical protein
LAESGARSPLLERATEAGGGLNVALALALALDIFLGKNEHGKIHRVSSGRSGAQSDRGLGCCGRQRFLGLAIFWGLGKCLVDVVGNGRKSLTQQTHKNV